MPIPLPNLDDRRWRDLVEEGRSLIPAWAPEWTDHNPSDPGITLIELFAYLTEMQLYQVDRISKSSLEAFWRLLEGPLAEAAGPVEDRLRNAVAGLQDVDRAVTAQDYEALAIQAGAGRALCIPHRNLATGKTTCIRRETPGHDSVVILPHEGEQESPELLEYVEQRLDQARMLVTQVHVVYPRNVEIAVRITVVPDSYADHDQVRIDAMIELQRFFDPYRGGPNRDGWPLGRNIYVSEIYALLEDLPGVDYVQNSVAPVSHAPVTEISVGTVQSGRMRFNNLGELEAVELLANELPRLEVSKSEIIV